MTETERRRNELLRETRKIYNEKYAPPAIHPRYQNAYQSIYKTNPRERQNSTFLARLLIAILLFGAFFAANQKGLKEAETVANEITSEFEGFVDLQIFRWYNVLGRKFVI